MKTLLLVIDMQNDFCKPEGGLYIPGAEADTLRLATFIRAYRQKIDDIWLSQDNHQIMDIAHPVFWEDTEGNPPLPFTTITRTQVEAGAWKPKTDKHEVVAYLKALEQEGEYVHTIWPEHCILGSEGAAIVAPVMESVQDWARQGHDFKLIRKGEYPLTEHLGIFQANVPCKDIPETVLKLDLIRDLATYDVIWMAGEAQSHCVAYSVKQLMNFPPIMRKLVLFADCMSPVAGSEEVTSSVFEAAFALGARFTTTTALMSNF